MSACMNDGLSITASLLADPGRAAMLLSLMSGTALPAGELANIANVAPQTASGHLTKLVDGRLLSVEHQGRHRYYRLASAEVADAIEALLAVAARPDTVRAATGTLRHARTCYGHLAGWLGVRIAEELQERALLATLDARTYSVTPPGREWFETLGIKQNAFAKRCLDWTERRHHLAGTLGCSMYRRFQELGWLAPGRETRGVRVTIEGKLRLWNLLRIPIE